MAAMNRSGIFALRLCSSRALSTTPKVLASTSVKDPGVSKKVELEDVETTFPRSKQMANLIEVEGAVDVGTTSVSFYKRFDHSHFID